MASTTRRPSTAASRRDVIAQQISLVLEELLRGGATFTELGVEQIATAAGISRSTFYLYFGDKTDLLLRLSSSLKSEIFELGDEWRPHAPDGGLEGLVLAYEKLIGRYRQHAALLGAINEVASYDRTVRESWAARQEQFVTRAAEQLAEEQCAGRTSADFDPQLAAWVMVSSGAEVISRHIAINGPDRDAALARELAASRWHGYYRRPTNDGDMS